MHVGFVATGVVAGRARTVNPVESGVRQGNRRRLHWQWLVAAVYCATFVQERCVIKWQLMHTMSPTASQRRGHPGVTWRWSCGWCCKRSAENH